MYVETQQEKDVIQWKKRNQGKSKKERWEFFTQFGKVIDQLIKTGVVCLYWEMLSTESN